MQASPLIDGPEMMSFLEGSLALFNGSRASHMGSYQYVDHRGSRYGQSMSGAKLWAGIEAAELSADDVNLFSAEERLLRAVAADIASRLPEGMPILEMGTGTPNAFRKKTLLLMMALRSIDYVCVDESKAFLDELIQNKALAQFNVTPIIKDFFDEEIHYTNDRGALVCMFGSTMGNIPAPLSPKPPTESLIHHLRLLFNAIEKGGALVSFDADMNGANITGFYSKQAPFQLNTFFRMACELPIEGDFDPYSFSYQAEWTPSSGQLAHMAIVDRDMGFQISGQKINLKAGQKLHMKNSFKFTPAFFAECAIAAGFSVGEGWADPAGTHVALLQKP